MNFTYAQKRSDLGSPMRKEGMILGSPMRKKGMILSYDLHIESTVLVVTELSILNIWAFFSMIKTSLNPHLPHLFPHSLGPSVTLSHVSHG